MLQTRAEEWNRKYWRLQDIGQRKKKRNKCKGTEDDLLCFKASRTKCQKLDNTAVLRQPNCPKIRDEGRRNSIVPTPDTCTTNLGTNEQLQSDCPVLPHSRSREHQGRSAQPEETPKEMVQDNQALLGKTNDRRFCYPTELPSENILELVTGSGGRSHRHIQPRLAEEGIIPPLWHFKKQVREAVLVSYDLTDDTPTANCDENEQPLDISRLEAIKQGHVSMGIDLDISSFLNQRIRKRTSQAYNHGWQKWMHWYISQEPKVDSLAYNTKGILRFFMDH